MADVIRIGPFACPVVARGNEHLRGRTAAHWSGRSKLVSEQRAMVHAAWVGVCLSCGRPWTACRYRDRWLDAPACSCRTRGPRRSHQLPPHGPQHPVDVHLVRIPRHRGRELDAHDGLPYALKAAVDQVTAELWPKGPDRKPSGTPDDSVPWLRWSYGQRPHCKARKRPRPGDPPPDPPNKGTELVEIWLAQRDDCPHCGRSMLPVRWKRVQGGGR
jgi:hypothetical protein